MRGWIWMWPLMVAFALTACGSGTGPDDDAPTPVGVSFGLGEGDFGNHWGQGLPSSQGSPLADRFAVAVPDSLGGLVLVSYDDENSNLFILQMTVEIAGSFAGAGVFECGPVTGGAPCHGRFFENVREEGGIVEVDGRLDIDEGTLEVRKVVPDELEASFSAEFLRTAGSGESGFTIINGSILVDLLEGPVENGDLACLIRLTAGATDCSG